jgi:dethiobiotin synthetase
MPHLCVLIGTGTSVGKTHVAERLLRAVAYDGLTAVGYKPVESGVAEGVDTDIARLRRASTFHVKPELKSLTFTAPVSPHLAARLEHREIDLELIRAEVRRANASEAGVVLIELPGGAFSPITDALSCAQLARSLPGAHVVLVALNRLGVLHDVASTSRACAAAGLPLVGVVLNEAPAPDESSSTNADELRVVTSLPLLARLPRVAADLPVTEGDPVLILARRLWRGARMAPGPLVRGAFA